MNDAYAEEEMATYTPADNSVLGEPRMSKEKLYQYTIYFELGDEEFSIRKEVFIDDVFADNTQEVAEYLKPMWDHWSSVIEKKADERYNEYVQLELSTFNVYRRSDDLCNDDDDTIPDPGEVSDELVRILETWRGKGHT